jgi:hypothetical protein
MNATTPSFEVKTVATPVQLAPREDAVVELSGAQLLLVGGGRGSVSLE